MKWFPSEDTYQFPFLGFFFSLGASFVVVPSLKIGVRLNGGDSLVRSIVLSLVLFLFGTGLVLGLGLFVFIRVM
jgi:hypothetical protein